MFKVCKLTKEMCAFCAIDSQGRQRCGFEIGENYILKIKNCPLKEKQEEKKERSFNKK